MKIKLIITMIVASFVFTGFCNAEIVKLLTSTVSPEDTNWDFWQQDQNEIVQEDAIYLGMFDGASGHSNSQPDYPTDGNVDGVYSTLSMGPGGAMINQSLGVSGTDPNEFPDNQRDTRVSALMNISKVIQLNSNPQDINECKFKWSIDYVMRWTGGSTYLMAPTTLYVEIFPADKQNYWRSDLDGNDLPTTDINDLQDEFDPNGAGITYAEKVVDIRVNNGPWGSGLQPLTNWYIQENGVQFYEVDVTAEVADLIAADPNKYADPNTAFIGFTIRASLDGESVYLSMDARDRLDQNPIPPTFEIDVNTYIGDFSANGIVNLKDFAIFAKSWLSEPGDNNWNAKCDLDNTGYSKDLIDCGDFQIFCVNWLDSAEGDS